MVTTATRTHLVLGLCPGFIPEKSGWKSKGHKKKVIFPSEKMGLVNQPVKCH
jgi:hypothetical protein